MRLISLFLVAFFFLRLASAADDEIVLPEYGSSGYSAMVLRAPSPTYPYKARVLGLVGSGIVLLEIDKRTGLVKSARMQPSTGHAILDEAALKAFRQWWFNPWMMQRVYGSTPARSLPVWKLRIQVRFAE